MCCARPAESPVEVVNSKAIVLCAFLVLVVKFETFHLMWQTHEPQLCEDFTGMWCLFLSELGLPSHRTPSGRRQSAPVMSVFNPNKARHLQRAKEFEQLMSRSKQLRKNKEFEEPVREESGNWEPGDPDQKLMQSGTNEKRAVDQRPTRERTPDVHAQYKPRSVSAASNPSVDDLFQHMYSN